MINTVLKPLIGKIVLVYLDNVIILEANFEERFKLLWKLFNLLRISGLTLKLEKYKFKVRNKIFGVENFRMELRVTRNKRKLLVPFFPLKNAPV